MRQIWRLIVCIVIIISLYYRIRQCSMERKQKKLLLSPDAVGCRNQALVVDDEKTDLEEAEAKGKPKKQQTTTIILVV